MGQRVSTRGPAAGDLDRKLLPGGSGCERAAFRAAPGHSQPSSGAGLTQKGPWHQHGSLQREGGGRYKRE